MKNKYVLFMLLGILLIGTMSASLGTFKSGSCVDIKTILNTSAVTISSINYPNSLSALGIKPMTKKGLTFNYTFCDTYNLGTYNYDYNDTEGNVYVNSFEITSSGSSSSNISNYFWILIILTWGVAFVGFFGRNVWVTVFGGMGMIVFGIYILTQGITIYENWVTQAISYFSMGIGAFFMIYSLIEYIEEEGDFG